MDAKPVVQMRGISKRFPGVLANDKVSFDLASGEVHTLLGENGAGKSTLMSILAGMIEPDEGEIYLHGERVSLTTPREAFNRGIGMVYQHFMLFSPFTVLENIILGSASARGPFLDLAPARKRLLALSQEYQLRINPEARIWQLSVGEQQRVEILKVLYRGAKILILDEPTAVLTPQETHELFDVLRTLKASGCSVVFISHKLEEVMQISDRISILRDGKLVQTVVPEETSKQGLAQLMVGRQVLFQLDRKPTTTGEVILQVEHLSADNDLGLPALRGISLELRQGEVLGIAGVAGNGQSELAEVLTGLRPAKAGRVRLRGSDITNHPAREILDLGLAHIPEDRQRRGLFMEMPLWVNLVYEGIHQLPFSKNGWLNHRAIRAFAQHALQQFAVKAPSPDVLTRQLSGGNQQRVILAREMSRAPRVIIAVQPTRGLDVGATEYVHNRLLEACRQGAAILLISTELEEILALSDRIAVMYEGQIMGMVEAGSANMEEIGLMMAGSKRSQAAEASDG